MDNVVLDASALLALFYKEPGAEKLTDEVLSASTVSTVNLAEVQAKLVRDGLGPDAAWREVMRPVTHLEAFTQLHARLAGTLIAQTKPYGLSLGDRACLALAISLNAPVYTADRAWKTLKVGCRIHVIR